MKTAGILMVLIGTLLFASCNSKQWKETVKTTIQLETSNSQVNFGSQHSLSIDTLTINVNSFSITGNRIQAEDIYLVSDAQSSASHIGNTGTFNATFDIPQGTYETFDLTTELSGQNSLQIRGVYLGPLGVPKRVEIDIQSNNLLITPLLENGEETILIDKNLPKQIIVNINVDSLLADVSPGLWNAAIATSIGGQEVIQISDMQNGNMYNEIIGRLSESFNCEVE